MGPSVDIGVHVHAEPEQLVATLEFLRAHTPPGMSVVLLPDGPDPETQRALARLPEIPQLPTAAPLGAAACFNRLVTWSQAEFLVLLESGSLVGPHWMEYLLAALGEDPAHGLAGPSTNRSWNEQCVLQQLDVRVPDTPSVAGRDEVARMAQATSRVFGPTWRTLEPLYSLADFCYAVRRAVPDTIGAADEAYGLGPCWEMDYNIRAARAGLRGVWARAAYVHRSQPTPRRAREEAARFGSSKRRYQDKFCALRLRREREGYEPHCRGDACEHFAPPALIELHHPWPPRERMEHPAHAPVDLDTLPLVSCIMATRDRRPFVLQSIRYFQRQDYPARELIILDDGVDDLAGEIGAGSSVRYVRVEPGWTIGAKRNRGCELARGSIIAHWDDDDWYAPGRLTAQVAPLIAGDAEVTALRASVFFDLERWAFWRCSPPLHRRLFVEDVHGGTLVYLRRCWEHFARYPDCSLAEDAGFLHQIVQHGARLGRLSNGGLFVYLRHRRNSWSFECGEFLDPQGWERVPEPAILHDDREFYATKSPAAPRSASGPPTTPAVSPAAPLSFHSASGRPLVSCLMPTANRRAFARQAIQYFLRQDYENRELIVLDNGTVAMADVIPADRRIRYVRLEAKQPLGATYNVACELARGEVLVHWDDDDWMAEWRLAYQVEELLRQPPATLCGLARLLFFEPQTRGAWEYEYRSTDRPWLGGGTLSYRRSFWEQHRFPDVHVGWDTRFVWSLADAHVFALPNHTFYVAMIHRANTSPKQTDGYGWRPFPPSDIQRLLDGDWSFYEALRGVAGIHGTTQEEAQTRTDFMRLTR